MVNTGTIIRNNEGVEFLVYTGERYSGEGYSGMTDGVIVTGTLLGMDKQWDTATLLCEKRKLPCAVKLRTLKLPKDE